MNRKTFVQDDGMPLRIGEIDFSTYSPEDIRNLSVVQLVNPMKQPIYVNSEPARNGPLDRRMGLSSKTSPLNPREKLTCHTCNEPLESCTGHFGHIKLAMPVYHIGFFKHIQSILKCICKSCSALLLSDDERRYYLACKRRAADREQRMAVIKTVEKKCTPTSEMQKECPRCGAKNGTIKAYGLRLVHKKFTKKNVRDVSAFDTAIQMNANIQDHVQKLQEVLHPMNVRTLLENLSSEDRDLLDQPHPERYVLTHILVPPNSIRPSVPSPHDPDKMNCDDLTNFVEKILMFNEELEAVLKKGEKLDQVHSKWESLQHQCLLMINSQPTATQVPAEKKQDKQKNGLFQRIKGKQGRIRGHLSGKRVNFSARTVISPDPNLGVHQVAVPVHIAKILTYTETVTEFNIAYLRQCILNGSQHPGATQVRAQEFAKDAGQNVAVALALLPLKHEKYMDRTTVAEKLQIGDIVTRHLHDGDIVLFNRQPSLHRLSIMAHEAKVMPGRTLRFNECVCAPYNADFDGDEMNIHFPQTEEAKAEAKHLMGVTNNLITPKSGEPIVAAIQDFITTAFLITRKGVFFDRSSFAQIAAAMYDAAVPIDLPPPAIIKPVELWTGKQIVSVMINPSRTNPVLIDMEVESNTYSQKDGPFCARDGYVTIRNSELLSGTLDKKTLGGRKSAIFHTLLRDYSGREAANCMSRLAKLSAFWITNYGFSIGVSDVTPPEELLKSKRVMTATGYQKCDEYLTAFTAGEMNPDPGFTTEQTLEDKMNKTLSDIRKEVGEECKRILHPENAPLIMSVCGSKGSDVNICQMVAMVGQQTVGGTRVPNGFLYRSLPHFDYNARTPSAKGFVENSFYSGMTAVEFFFHTMGGREGLVDTSCKTADTGYMSRRLMKALEDLTIQYDYTVRNTDKSVVQFRYGDDSIEPTHTEGTQAVLDLQRLFLRTDGPRPTPPARGFTGDELRSHLQDIGGISALLEPLALESGRQFIASVSEFLEKVATELDELHASMAYILDASSWPSHLSLPTPEQRLEIFFHSADAVLCMTADRVSEFLGLCAQKYHKALVEPGTPVGAICSQSVGEPTTQMTLKTFHFAGVASMNITQGVPRINEIINANKEVSTPIITAPLQSCNDLSAARKVQALLDTTYLGDVAKYISEVYTSTGLSLKVELDLSAIRALNLRAGSQEVKASIVATAITLDTGGKKKTKLEAAHIDTPRKDTLLVSPPVSNPEFTLFAIHTLKQLLPTVVVQGNKKLKRAVVLKKRQEAKKTPPAEEGSAANDGEKEGEDVKMGEVSLPPGEEEAPMDEFSVIIEGNDLQAVLNTPGIDSKRATSNSILVMEEVLGVEAARSTIIHEIKTTMEEHGIDNLDVRHLYLLADVMTAKGEVLGIQRHGLRKMKDGVLVLASFETPIDIFLAAAARDTRDVIKSVSDSIIVGNYIPSGTGIFQLLKETTKELPKPPPLLFSSYEGMSLPFVPDTTT